MYTNFLHVNFSISCKLIVTFRFVCPGCIDANVWHNYACWWTGAILSWDEFCGAYSAVLALGVENPISLKMELLLVYIYFPHNFISTYLHVFVTTRQSSTYKQSTMDSEVREFDCIRTLVTSYGYGTHNNTPKVTGNRLIQCATAITWSIFLKLSQQTTRISPVRAKKLCVSSLHCVLLLSVQCCV